MTSKHAGASGGPVPLSPRLNRVRKVSTPRKKNRKRIKEATPSCGAGRAVRNGTQPANAQQAPGDVENVTLVRFELPLGKRVVGNLTEEGRQRRYVEQRCPGHGAHEVERIRTQGTKHAGALAFLEDHLQQSQEGLDCAWISWRIFSSRFTDSRTAILAALGFRPM